jgi:hypothetical protein
MIKLDSIIDFNCTLMALVGPNLDRGATLI